MRINRMVAWLLVTGVFAVVASVGGILFLLSLLGPFGRLVGWGWGFLGIIAFIGSTLGYLAYIWFGLRAVPESELWVVEVFGSFSYVARPGLTILLTGIEKVRSRQTTRDQFVDVDTENTITGDNATVSFKAKLFFHLNEIDREAAYKATYAFELGEEDPEEAIKGLAESTLRSIAGNLDYEYLKDHQDQLNDLVLTAIKEKMLAWGFLVQRHIITELIPEKDVRDAVQKKLIATAEGEATVATAEANKRAVMATADADLYRKTQEAEAQKVREEKDAQGDAAALKALQAELGGDFREAARFRLGEKAVESGGGTGALAAALMSLLSLLRPPEKP